jgi:hypothetical protein
MWRFGQAVTRRQNLSGRINPEKKMGGQGCPWAAHKVDRREMTGETAAVRTENG